MVAQLPPKQLVWGQVLLLLPIRFIYYIYNYRLLYYLPMERMRNKDLENAWAVQWIRQEKCAKLEEENKKLNDKIGHLEFDIEAWKKLKAVWEKKEQKLQIEIWWLMWERDGLKMVVERLHKELDECECSFWFENDEVWFWKWEYKRLKKWIKDHCKWYWNLFPEDEMKRQWKKADKKRK